MRLGELVGGLVELVGVLAALRPPEDAEGEGTRPARVLRRQRADDIIETQ